MTGEGSPTLLLALKPQYTLNTIAKIASFVRRWQIGDGELAAALGRSNRKRAAQGGVPRPGDGRLDLANPLIGR